MKARQESPSPLQKRKGAPIDPSNAKKPKLQLDQDFELNESDLNETDPNAAKKPIFGASEMECSLNETPVVETPVVD